MKPAFNLAEYRRRPQPLREPPAGYFDQLPTRIMNRRPAPRTAGWAWWAQLPAAWRTSLASAAVLAGFAGAFGLSSIPTTSPAPAVAAVALDAVPQAELTAYLLTSGVRVENSDLAVLTAANPNLPQTFLHTSTAEVNDLLEEQPADEAAYF